MRFALRSTRFTLARVAQTYSAELPQRKYSFASRTPFALTAEYYWLMRSSAVCAQVGVVAQSRFFGVCLFALRLTNSKRIASAEWARFSIRAVSAADAHRIGFEAIEPEQRAMLSTPIPSEPMLLAQSGVADLLDLAAARSRAPSTAAQTGLLVPSSAIAQPRVQVRFISRHYTSLHHVRKPTGACSRVRVVSTARGRV